MISNNYLMKSINFKKITIELHDGSNEIARFGCGHNDLNEFLKEDSLLQSECMFNSTYLAIYNNEIIGFFTLLTDRIKIKDLEEEYQEKFKNKVSYNEFPAIKIGRLGVSSLFRKKGVGTYLLQMIFERSIELSKKVGFRFVTIDVFISSYYFYKKNNCIDSFSNEKLEKEFKKFKKTQQHDPQTANNMTVPMYKDLYKFKKNLLEDYVL